MKEHRGRYQLLPLLKASEKKGVRGGLRQWKKLARGDTSGQTTTSPPWTLPEKRGPTELDREELAKIKTKKEKRYVLETRVSSDSLAAAAGQPRHQP